MEQVNCTLKNSHKGTREGRTQCVYIEFIEYSSSTLNSAAEKVIPTDISQVITSATAKMKKRWED